MALISWHCQGTPDPKWHGLLLGEERDGRRSIEHQVFSYTTVVEARRKAKRLSLITDREGSYVCPRVAVYRESKDYAWTCDDYITAENLRGGYLLRKLRGVYQRGRDILPDLIRECEEREAEEEHARLEAEYADGAA